MRRVIQRRSFYKKDGTKEWFLGERWYRGHVFKGEDSTKEWFLGEMDQRRGF